MVPAGSTLSFEYVDNRNVCNPDWGGEIFSSGTVFTISFAPVLLPGDFDIDADMDMFDYVSFAMWWGDTNCNEPNWCGGVDFDKNGAVDWEDLHCLLYNWLLGK